MKKMLVIAAMVVAAVVAHAEEKRQVVVNGDTLSVVVIPNDYVVEMHQSVTLSQSSKVVSVQNWTATVTDEDGNVVAEMETDPKVLEALTIDLLVYNASGELVEITNSNIHPEYVGACKSSNKSKKRARK